MSDYQSDMQASSAFLREAIWIEATGRNARTPKELVWKIPSHGKRDPGYSVKVFEGQWVDNRICSRCNARAGKCDHGERYLR